MNLNSGFADPNRELVESLYLAFSKGDVEAMLRTLSPDVEWGEPDNPLNPSSGTRHGYAGFLEWLRIGKESEEILVLEPRQFLTGEGTVAAVGYEKCRVKSTGMTYESDFVHLITISDGKVIRFQEFFDTFAASEAFRGNE